MRISIIIVNYNSGKYINACLSSIYKEHKQNDIDLIVVGDASIIEISEAISDLEAKLHRPIHMSLYNSEEWLDLKANDPVVAQIATGQKMMVLENNNPLC